MRRVVVQLRTQVVALTVVALAGGAAEAAEPKAGGWTRPVPSEVARPFEVPVSRYAAGHRGVDLAAAPGTPVRAAGAGTVSFAGPVAGALHVVVAHDGGLRTSYSFLREVRVQRGERVAPGAVVGISGGAGGDHAGDVLHFGLRRGDDYLDPMLLFAVTDLTELVRLVPVDGNEPGGPWPVPPDQQLLLREFGRPPRWVAERFAKSALEREQGPDDAIVGAVSAAAGVGHDVARWTSAELERVGGAALTLSGELAQQVADWSARNVPAVAMLEDLREIGSRFADWIEHRRACDADAPPADGTGGSGHTLLAVAGVNSATGASGATFSLDADALGYFPEEVEYFSYAADGGDYAQEDTWVDLHVAARRLAEQLKARQRAEPGREVDLIAHSQGGVVVDVFLQYLYDPADATYPPIGTVVTLSSPHEGAPLASAIDRVDDSRVGRAVLELRARDLGLPLGRSTGQLSEHSELMADLWRRPLHEQLDVTSIGATDDVVVPANRTDVPGATTVTMVVDDVADHGAIPSDPGALRAVRAALEGRAPPCVPFVDGVRGAVTPVVISRAETVVGDATGGIGHAADRQLWRLGR